MPKFISIKDYDPWKNPPEHWPAKDNAVVQHDVSIEQYEQFRKLLASASETEVERFLAENHEVLSMLIWMFSTGHHMSWLYPKPQVRPPSTSSNGLIPDYLAAGANSDGVSWFVLELKSPQANAFKRSKNHVVLSSDSNLGVSQLLTYIDAISRDQAYLRDTLGLRGVREPRGVVLIGRDAETQDDQIREFKRAWNAHNPKLQIKSYDALLRQLEGKLRDFNRFK